MRRRRDLSAGPTGAGGARLRAGIDALTSRRARWATPGSGLAAGSSSDPTDAGRRERECRALLGILGETGSPPVRRRYDRGQTIHGEDEPAAAFYVVTEGLAKLATSRSSGKDATLRMLGPWDVFGDVVSGAYTNRRTRAEAVTTCEVTKIPKVFLERTLRKCPEASLKLATLLDLELARYQEWVGCLLPRKVEARLANLLPLLALRFGKKDSGGTVILPRLTHEELAGMVGSTRESVTAVLGALRRRGMIGTEKGRILILQPVAPVAFTATPLECPQTKGGVTRGP